jgi:hypothetical protein
MGTPEIWPLLSYAQLMALCTKHGTSDVHTARACEHYGIKPGEVTKRQRKEAKDNNFLTLYTPQQPGRLYRFGESVTGRWTCPEPEAQRFTAKAADVLAQMRDAPQVFKDIDFADVERRVMVHELGTLPTGVPVRPFLKEKK